MADGYTFSEQPLHHVAPAGDLDDKIVQDMWEQSLAGLMRFFSLFIPPEFNGSTGIVTTTATSYGAADYTWEVKIPDEPRHVEFAILLYKGSAPVTSVEAKLNFDGVDSAEVSETTTTPTLKIMTFDQTFLSTRKDTTKTLDLHLKKTGGSGADTARVAPVLFPRCRWLQAP